ncbi:beta-ketoacyl-ACP synthase III [Sphingobacterium paludis]|jgi:3-oxoacyl-[acyl-carrier-protein] synthase III|uniref:3-oxoacyl-[acyl-carrier-protein] synthase-3 n=1 Tax=Sphingobacterium paludis TaxID=1476465 RepID=A0A4R7D4H1_9SPHI|nr:beta-ketoacyl-ACP synthase III [Sphingobacterium paludis]TDS14544.1 3-oxoacyl-[acyl-carrier-protein] synthase-3 [Sphingobacterium paludis]
MNEVYINKIAKFLPNAPVDNEGMESFLGKINDRESKARRIVLRNNGIKTRYYALTESGSPTHTNAELTAEAINGLFDDAFKATDMELLSCGTSSPDYLMPSHAVMVHGELGNRNVEVNSAAGNCCAGMNALKFGFLSVKSGNTNNAVCTGSERMSSWMLADHFNKEVENLKQLEQQPIIGFNKDFLRWMLSDGAGAMLLENEAKGEMSLKIEWMEGYSYAHELDVCMYAGADKTETGALKSFSDYTSEEWLSKSIFAVKQDTKLLDKHILSKGVESMKLAMEKNNISPADIDYLLPHVSSQYFVDGLYQGFADAGIEIERSKWYMNLRDVGNVGAGSVYLVLEELFHSGKLKKGQHIMLCVPESARFTYAYAYLTVC